MELFIGWGVYNDGINKHHVISFDINSEVFHLFPLPDCIRESDDYLDGRIYVYGGLLSVIRHGIRQVSFL